MKKGIISIISALLGGIVGAGVVGKTMMEKENSIQTMSDKHFSLFLMMNQWVKVKQEGKSLAEYFKKEGYKKPSFLIKKYHPKFYRNFVCFSYIR